MGGRGWSGVKVAYDELVTNPGGVMRPLSVWYVGSERTPRKSPASIMTASAASGSSSTSSSGTGSGASSDVSSAEWWCCGWWWWCGCCCEWWWLEGESGWLGESADEAVISDTISCAGRRSGGSTPDETDSATSSTASSPTDVGCGESDLTLEESAASPCCCSQESILPQEDLLRLSRLLLVQEEDDPPNDLAPPLPSMFSMICANGSVSMAIKIHRTVPSQFLHTRHASRWILTIQGFLTRKERIETEQREERQNRETDRQTRSNALIERRTQDDTNTMRGDSLPRRVIPEENT